MKRYKDQHSIDEYTFPKEAYIHDVTFDEKCMHVELTDQRMISIPLRWIPTVYNASMGDAWGIYEHRLQMVADTWLSGLAVLQHPGHSDDSDRTIPITTNSEAVCIENPIYFLFCLPCS